MIIKWAFNKKNLQLKLTAGSFYCQKGNKKIKGEEKPE